MTPLPNTAQSRFPVWLMAVLLALVTIVVYWPATSHDFVNYDDSAYVTDNPRVQAGLTWEGLAWAFGQVHGEATYWHPLTWISHMLDCQWYGLNPWGHHLTNVLLHAANVVLVFLVLRRTTRGEGKPGGWQNGEGRDQSDGSFWRCAMVAGLFALHPLQVDAVAWVAERKTLLSALFWLLAMGAYVRYVEVRGERGEGRTEGRGASGETNSKSRTSNMEHPASSTQPPTPRPSPLAPHPSTVWYLLALLLFALGLMCKPVLVTFPFVLLLLDYWPLGRMGKEEGRMQNEDPARAADARDGGAGPALGGNSQTPTATRQAATAARKSEIVYRILLEKLPFFVLAAASSFITLLAHQGLGILNWVSWDMRIENALVSYVRYLGKALWPSRLAVFYPYPAAWPLWEVAACGLVLLVISGLVVRAARSRPWWLVGWFWFLGVLVPFSGLIQAGAQAMADRFMYVPLLGLLLGVIWGLHWLTRGRPYQRVALSLAGGAAMILCLGLTRQQLAYWKNGETLFGHALEVTENNYLAHKVIGDNLDLKGRTSEAIRQYREAIRLKPNYALARNNLGNVLDRIGQTNEAFSQFKEAVRFDPGEPLSHYNLGNALARRGQIAEAISHYQAAIRLKPGDAAFHNNLGDALARNGQNKDALSQFQEALRLKPDYADAYYNLGNALARNGQLAEAIGQYREAVRLNPDNALPHNNLAKALAASGQSAEAIGQYQEVLRLNPERADAHYNLGNALAANGRIDEAISQYQEALRLRPDSFQPHLALALILPRAGRVKDAAAQMDEFLRICPPARLEAPNNPVRQQALGALNDLAWLLASRPQAEERDGARAVRFAERACELTEYRVTVMVGTLAAAYAEAGRFPEAVATAQKAITLATQAGDQALLARNRQLLELYRAGRPYHEAAAPAQSPPASPP